MVLCKTAAHAIVVELVYTLDLKSNALTEIVSSSLTDSTITCCSHIRLLLCAESRDLGDTVFVAVRLYKNCNSGADSACRRVKSAQLIET